MSSEINIELLASLLKKKRGKQGLRDTAKEIGGISASTLSRVEQGKVPDLDSFIKLCRWLKIDTDKVMLSAASHGKNFNGEEKSIKDKVAFHLRADQTLPSETAEALIKMIELAYQLENAKED